MSITAIKDLPDSRRRLAVFDGEVRFIDPAWADELHQLGLTLESDWSSLSAGTCVSESEITNCFKIDLAGNRSIYFKRYTYPKSKQSRYWMRASKAQVEIFGYRQLKIIGVPTLKVIAFGESRSYGRLRAAYIITQGINRSMDLQQFAREVWFPMPKQQRSKLYLQLRQQIFDQLQRAHERNFYHQDLHWRNILVTNDNGHYQTTWIDCPRAAFRKLPFSARHGQMVDLSSLGRRSLDYLSRSERYRALAAYLRTSDHGWTPRALFREIQAHHERSPNPPKPLGIPGSEKQFRP